MADAEIDLPSVQELEEDEATLRRAIGSFIEAGKALARIRDKRTYQLRGFPTFEEYCRKTWGWGRNYVYKQIAAAEVVSNVCTTVHTPISERQARELAPLAPDHQREIAATIDFENTTAAEIRNRVRQELKTVKPKPASSQPTTNGAVDRFERGLVAAAELPQPITREQLYQCLGSKASKKHASHQWDRALMLVPWLRVVTVANGKVRVTLDQELKEMCDRRRSGGELPMEFARRFFKEFMRRRREADLANSNRSWNPDAICKMDLIDILIWVECEMQTYIAGLSTNAREKAKQQPRAGKGSKHDNENRIGIAAADAGTSTAI